MIEVQRGSSQRIRSAWGNGPSFPRRHVGAGSKTNNKKSLRQTGVVSGLWKPQPPSNPGRNLLGLPKRDPLYGSRGGHQGVAVKTYWQVLGWGDGHVGEAPTKPIYDRTIDREVRTANSSCGGRRSGRAKTASRDTTIPIFCRSRWSSAQTVISTETSTTNSVPRYSLCRPSGRLFLCEAKRSWLVEPSSPQQGGQLPVLPGQLTGGSKVPRP